MKNDRICPRCGIPESKHCDELAEMRREIEKLIDLVADNAIKSEETIKALKRSVYLNWKKKKIKEEKRT